MINNGHAESYGKRGGLPTWFTFQKIDAVRLALIEIARRV
jgi:hypothetical protein